MCLTHCVPLSLCASPTACLPPLLLQELQKSEANVALLERDWRLGHVRLANPFGGPHPPGMQRVDTAACEPRMLVHSQLGML